MRVSNQATAEPRSASPETPAEPVAFVELDRFCEACGYNLRTLPVHRDAHTRIPVVRCTECGRFQPANETSAALRPWLRRATSLLLAAWILTVVAGLVLLATAEIGLCYGTLDEFTVHGGYATQRINNTTIRTWSSFGPLEVRAGRREDKLFITSVMIGSFGIAFVCGLYVVVVFPHWRRAAYAGLVLGMPVVTGGLVAGVWSQEAPHLFYWGMPYMTAHAGLQLLGGLMGIAWGRPVARLSVRIFLPPSQRPRLAYLWLADGKPMPRP